MNDPRWIPVMRELPKKNGDYLCTCISPGRAARVFRCRFTGGKFKCLNVVAWMVEPAPYEEQIQEDPA